MLINKEICINGDQFGAVLAPSKYKITALQLPLGGRNLIVLKANKGYGMCGYLDMGAAVKFGDAAFKFSGAASIEEALDAKVSECSPAAAELGIAAGQTVKQALALLFRTILLPFRSYL